MSNITIEPAADVAINLDSLRREADDEGIRVVGIVIDRWVDGTQRYDVPGERRHGIARDLATRLIDSAAHHTSMVTCNARASAAAPPFWESLGFTPVATDGITHVLDLPAM